MIRYIIKRLLQLIPTLLIITVVVFTIVKMTPGNPIGANLNPNATPEQRMEEYKRLGYDKPLHEQYFDWLTRSLKGDFGRSYNYKQPVKDIIGTYILNTFYLNVFVFLIGFFLSIPIGIICAVKKDSFVDRFWSGFSLVGISMPTFFFGLLLIVVFSVKLKWTPINGMIEAGSVTVGFARVKEVLHHMILPGIVLIFDSMASLLRYTRTAVLDILNQDYIRTARAKGLSERVVIYKHAFKNSLIPIVTLLGFRIPALFSGAVMLETVFNWPGLGRIMVESVTGRDYNLMIALLVFFAILTLLGNLLADVLYAAVDPRIKVGDS